MKLVVAERLMLGQLLPKAEGNVLTLRIVRDLQREIGFTEEELQALGIGSEVEYKCPHCETLVSAISPPDFCPNCKEKKPGWEAVRPTGRTVWNAQANQEKEIEIGPQAKKVVADMLEAISNAGKLTMNQLALYEKFVEDNTEETKE